LEDEDKHFVRGFKNLTSIGVNHFKGLFKETKHIIMDSILKKLMYLANLLDKETNVELFHEIYIEELKGVIYSFEKDKIPRPNGWCIEFFEKFFETVWVDLLRVVEEV
jgi:hypothetical protein